MEDAAPAVEPVNADSQRAFHARMLGTALKTDTNVAGFYLDEAQGDPRIAVAMHRTQLSIFPYGLFILCSMSALRSGLLW